MCLGYPIYKVQYKRCDSVTPSTRYSTNDVSRLSHLQGTVQTMCLGYPTCKVQYKRCDSVTPSTRYSTNDVTRLPHLQGTVQTMCLGYPIYKQNRKLVKRCVRRDYGVRGRHVVIVSNTRWSARNGPNMPNLSFSTHLDLRRSKTKCIAYTKKEKTLLKIVFDWCELPWVMQNIWDTRFVLR